MQHIRWCLSQAAFCEYDLSRYTPEPFHVGSVGMAAGKGECHSLEPLKIGGVLLVLCVVLCCVCVCVCVCGYVRRWGKCNCGTGDEGNYLLAR